MFFFFIIWYGRRSANQSHILFSTISNTSKAHINHGTVRFVIIFIININEAEFEHTTHLYVRDVCASDCIWCAMKRDELASQPDTQPANSSPVLSRQTAQNSTARCSFSPAFLCRSRCTIISSTAKPHQRQCKSRSQLHH